MLEPDVLGTWKKKSGCESETRSVIGSVAASARRAEKRAWAAESMVGVGGPSPPPRLSKFRSSIHMNEILNKHKTRCNMHTHTDYHNTNDTNSARRCVCEQSRLHLS
jgi:hypothetical protein